MGEPRPHLIRNTLAAIAVAGVTLAAIAGCSSQSPTTHEKEPIAGATEDPVRGAPAARMMLASGAAAAPDGAVREGPERTAGKSLGNAEKFSRLRKKGLPQPAPSLSSLPVGREVKESSHLLCRVPSGHIRPSLQKSLFPHPAREESKTGPAQACADCRSGLARRGPTKPAYCLYNSGHWLRRWSSLGRSL